MKQFVVSKCKNCSAPIYGPKEIELGTIVQARFSCTCYRLVQETMKLHNALLKEQLKCMRECHKKNEEGEEWKQGEDDDDGVCE